MKAHLEKYIKDLLVQYDCVVVPEFGGFVCSANPAKIHPVQHRFTPPGKKISFNKLLKANDGLLIHNIAVSNGVTYEEAHVWLFERVTFWKQALSEKSSISLPDIGRLEYDNSGNLLFEQDPTFNFLIDSFGLPTFQSIPIDRDAALKMVHDGRVKEPEMGILPSINKMAKYSVAAAMLSLVALTSYKLNLLDNLPTDVTSLNPFKTEASSYLTREYPAFVNNESIESSRIKEKIGQSEGDVLSLSITEDGLERPLIIKLRDKKKAKLATNSIKRFHVVGGCFGVESNAEKLLKRLKRMGYNADTSVTHNGLRVVSYQSFENKSEAQYFLTKIKTEQNNQAWLLVK